MVVLITGISSGFGRAMAQRLSAEGHTVYGTHRNAGERIHGVTYLKADITDEEQVNAAVDTVLQKEGRIDVFINNAGMGYGGPLEFASVEDARAQMDVNWLGMVRFLHRIVPIMRSQGEGKIICVSSIGGLMGLPFQGLYSASKFAIEGYLEALRLETRDFRIKVIAIQPGDFATSFTYSRRAIAAKEVQAAYPKYATSLSSIEHDETTGLKPEYLAGKISRIIKSKRPANHYVIASPLQKLAVFAKRILPSKLFETILAWYYKLI